jgi:hypothetical protein
MDKYKKRKYKFDFEGSVYEVRYPTAGEKRDYEKSCYDIATGNLDKNFYDYHKEYLLGLGMDEKLYDQMIWNDLEEVTLILMGQKKTSNGIN